MSVKNICSRWPPKSNSSFLDDRINSNDTSENQSTDENLVSAVQSVTRSETAKSEIVKEDSGPEQQEPILFRTKVEFNLHLNQTESSDDIPDAGCRGVGGLTPTDGATSPASLTPEPEAETMANARPRAPYRFRSLDVLSIDQEVGVSDAVLLDPLTEDAFIANLLVRFKRDHIYTYIGNVLLSVNPYKPLALYTGEVIEAYKSRSMFELPPHVFAVADCAWRSLRDHHSDQVIIITGESGAGKTEASKLILQYVAAASGRSRDLEPIKQQLLLSNPVLEAFGNAKTHRNDNSSRFGKYMDVEFDFKGEPLGGVITNYLLEKSRVTAQAPGERNFHIFYQLLAGADVQLLKTLKIQRNTENYNFLKNARTSTPVSQTDKDDFLATKKAMENLGFAAEEIVNIFKIVAAVLKLGNLSFAPVNNIDGTEGCTILNDYELEDVAFLLSSSVEDLRSAFLYRILNVTYLCGEPSLVSRSRDSSLQRDSSSRCHSRIVSQSSSFASRELFEAAELLRSEGNSLHCALTSRTVEAKNDFVTTDLSAAEATYARDALCKALYSRLFTWIVSSINEKIKVKQHGKRKVLGVLDIYGFEILQENSFEQFVINFCNEKLQQVFIELTLKEEQEEYVREGLEWKPVNYFDNATICDLIEKNNCGILALLDEECLRPGHVTDETFLEKISSAFQGHAHFESRQQQQRSNYTDHSLAHDAFRLKHYAGAVTYKVSGFVDKNNDLLFRDLSQVMYRCSHPVLKELFPEGNPRRTTLRRPATAGSQFKVSINALMKNLTSKNPHYVRCIKPNEMKQPAIFEMALVQHQVRYLGLMENVRVRRAGFAYRQTYASFLQRYKMLSPLTWPHWEGPSIEGVARLLRDLPISATEYAFGRTKIFIKNPQTVTELEDFRRMRLHDLAVLVQKIFRGWRCRHHYRKMKKSQIVIAAAWKRYKQRCTYLRIRNAIVTMQSYYRARKDKIIDVDPQSHHKWRFFHLARKEYNELRQRRRMVWAVGVIERYYIAWRRKRYLIRLSYCLPSTSPLCREWPSSSPVLHETNQLLKKIFHKWRCHKYRLQFDQTGRNRMREKVTASLIFRGRKESYCRSVAHPFLGDYVRLRQNTQWRKLAADTVDHYVVFADIVSKISRTSGRLVPVLFVVSTTSMLLLDQRTLHVKYRIPASDVVRISLSPFMDDIAVFHIKSFGVCVEPRSVQNLPGCLFQTDQSSFHNRKGDLVLQTCHLIELVTKIFLVVQNAAGKPPEVNINSDFEANFGNQVVEFCFRCVGLPEVQPGQVRIARRGHRMEVTL